MNRTAIDKPKTKRRRKFAREPQGEPAVTNRQPSQNATDVTTSAQPEPKTKSKASLLVDLLARSEGASLEQMAAATGWLPHTTRAALTGLKKKGHAVTSTKTDGVRTYRLVTADCGQLTSPAETEAKMIA